MEDVMNSSIRVVNSFRIVLTAGTLAPLWLMLAAAGTSADAQVTPSPADWTQFHRDNMQRWNPYETVLGVGNVGGLQVKWKNPIGVYGNNFESSPAVVNGVVYFGSDDGNVYALDASTGAKLWSYATGNVVVSSPAVANGVVYVGSANGNVYALNAGTGAKLWSFTTGSSVNSSPAVANGVVYVGSFDQNVYALNASTGAKLWSYATGADVFSSPAVSNGMVYVGPNDGNVYALNASTGAKVWSFTTGAGVDSSPAVVNGVVYIGSLDGKVYALDATNGSLLWSYKTTFNVESSPAVANGVVYVGSDGYRLYALNASTGSLLWAYDAGGEILSSPAVANGVVYVTSANGSLFALDADTGAKLWYYPAGLCSSSPTIVDGVVYIRWGDIYTGIGDTYAFAPGSANSADLFLRILPSTTTVHQGDLLTFAFPVWNLGPGVAEGEVLSNLQVPAGTTFDYLRISGTPGLGTCTHPPYGGTGQIICHEGDGMAPNTTWTVRLTVKVTAPAGTVITESAATLADTPDPNMANNTATVSVNVE
jgi:outer membrane protein assembly factor BamB